MANEPIDRDAINEAWERAKAKEAAELNFKDSIFTQTNEDQNSLILCPVCNNQCSPSALACPSCGHPLAKDKKNSIGNSIDKLFHRIRSQYKDSRRRMFLIIFVGIIVISSISYGIYKFLNIENFERERLRRELYQEADSRINELCEKYPYSHPKTECLEMKIEKHKEIDAILDGK